jgi:DNA-binding transcriptional LysR family regulator
VEVRKAAHKVEIDDLKSLRLLTVLADYKSFRKAAQAVQLSQSALSRRIRSLEDNIGVSIFERHSGGVRLTSVGAEFVNTIAKALKEIDQAISIAGQAGYGALGLLRVGIYTSLSKGNLRELFAEYIDQFPAVRIWFLEANANQLAAHIHSRFVDLVIVTKYFSPQINLDVLPLWQERVMLALPRGHALTRSERILWGDLADQKLVLMRRDPGPQLLEIINKQLKLPSGHPAIEQHDVNLDNLLSIVAAGGGITALYESATGIEFPAISYRELWDKASTESVDYFAYWSPSNDNPALRRFLSLLRKRFYELRAPLPREGDRE